MTDRDRLIELLFKVTEAKDCPQPDEIADYLLANGVILPPCKVGDTVYCVDDFLKIVEKCKVYGFTFVNKKIRLLVDNAECKFVTPNWHNTKEQAEEKLKECEG